MEKANLSCNCCRHVIICWYTCYSLWYVCFQPSCCLCVTIFPSGKVKTDLYMSGKRLTYSCCPHVTMFTIRKAKTGLNTRWKGPRCTCCPRITIFTSGKAEKLKTGCRVTICWYTSYSLQYVCLQASCSHITIFTSGKAKSWPWRHNLPVYQLLSKVRLSPSQLRPSRYDFYDQKSENG